MSTVTELDLYRRGHRAVLMTNKVQPASAVPGRDLRALWGDALATLAIVSLAAAVVFELLRR
ncbi:MAG TPA: hypothetical protein VND64_10555 [Pirellulales bacterium]|nr:hypothetical protein [Pirellulales bacterium]